MSEELEWELYDIFESAMFPFPIYDHKSARQIVRYLLRRGILEEEIADAIEDSIFDLTMWLNRAGKHMVGEWVIAWINDCREDYLIEKARTRARRQAINSGSYDSYGVLRSMSTESRRSSTSSAGSDDMPHTRRHSQDTDLESESSSSEPTTDNRSTSNDRLTPETMSAVAASSSVAELPDFGIDLELLESLYGGGDSAVDLLSTSGVCSCMASESSTSLVSVSQTNQNLPTVCSNCAGALPQYISNTQQELFPSCPQVLFPDTVTPAMDFCIDTVDREGPGYLYIMTDAVDDSLAWSAEHHYKVASSRQPESCLMELQSRNVPIKLLWQVRVRHHARAADEVQIKLNNYNLHTNWYKCSLAVIMEAVAAVAAKYR